METTRVRDDRSDSAIVEIESGWPMTAVKPYYMDQIHPGATP